MNEDTNEMLQQKTLAFDLISNFVRGTPYQSEIASIARPAFPTSKATANAMNTNPSLVHRAMQHQPHLLQQIISSPAKSNAKPHLLTTAQLEDAHTVLNSLAPCNSAQLRKSNYSIIGLYRKYCEQLKSPLPPVNEEYFRKLVHELGIICNVESQGCTLCDLWSATICGSTLSADLYGKCETHFRTVQFQVESYYSFMQELVDGCFGKRMFKASYSGALIVIDFGQLDPSTKRHKDGVLHFWLVPLKGSKCPQSIPFHYIGDEASDQPASVGFAIDCIKHAASQDKVKDLELLVFFSDGGAKEFNSQLIAHLPDLELELKKKISWNYWAANHGAGVSDSDQQNARSTLHSELPERKVINDTSSMVDILSAKQPGANFFNASSFRRSVPAKYLPDVKGISKFHCFNVENGSIIGYQDSWRLSGVRNFSKSFKALSDQQEYLKARHDAGMDVHYCKPCNFYYVESHTCKRTTDLEESEVITKKLKIGTANMEVEPLEKELLEQSDVPARRKVDVYHNDGLWYCGSVVTDSKKTCCVHFCDGEDGRQVKKRDILDCIHDPQKNDGSSRGLPDYLKVRGGKK